MNEIEMMSVLVAGCLLALARIVRLLEVRSKKS